MLNIVLSVIAQDAAIRWTPWELISKHTKGNPIVKGYHKTGLDFPGKWLLEQTLRQGSPTSGQATSNFFCERATFIHSSCKPGTPVQISCFGENIACEPNCINSPCIFSSRAWSWLSLGEFGFPSSVQSSSVESEYFHWKLHFVAV